MNRYRILVGILAFVSLFGACRRHAGPQSCKTSEIPERREFPLNEAASPCDDFYAHVCSRVVECFQLREDRSRHIFAFHDSSERLLEKKKAFLAGLSSATRLSERGGALRDYYLACMDAGSRREEETRFVESTLKEIESLKDRDAVLRHAAARVVSPEFGFLSFSRLTNLDASDWYDVYFESGGLMTLPEPSYYKEAEIVSDLRNAIAAFFVAIGRKEPAAKARAADIVRIETTIAGTYPPAAERRKLFNERRLIGRETLIARYPALHLEIPLARVPARTAVRHLYDANFETVEKLLKETPLETLKDFYAFKALRRWMDEAYPDLYRIWFEFNHRHLGGPAKRPEREERCAFRLMNDFDKELDAELIEKLFPAFPRERFEALVEKVRKSMIERIRKNRWLSAKGKKAALEKMESASMQLVKPRNDAEWDFLPTRSYDRKAYIANRKSRDLVRIDRLVEEFGKPRNRERWTMAPLTVNAYYSPADNKFVMLQGILQFPFFDAGLSDAANLGAAGVVVGHELGHAIDDQGSKYDAKGRLRRWMTPEDLKTFQRLAASLVAQYDAAGHDGSLTLGENIADVTGLSFAYGAAFPNNEGTPEEKQAFFIQYGRAWCGTMRPAERVRRLKTDPHAQTETRVNEPLKHQPGFYEAFGCKVGDKMYLPPEKRLSLW